MASMDAPRRRSVLLSALAYLAKKEADRDHLTAGNTRVQGVVTATIGRACVEYAFSGELLVGEDQSSASSSAPDPAHVCALLLKRLPEQKRWGALEKIANDFAVKGQLPDVEPEMIEAVKKVLARLRSRVTTTKRGAVTFRWDPPADAAAKAA